MIRYIFLSVFALLLLTACGDGLTDQEGGQEPVTDTSSQGFSNVSGNQAGAASVSDGAISVGTTKYYFRSRIGREELVSAYSAGHDLTGVILSGVNLSGLDLTYANLSEADLTGAILTAADLTDAVLTDATLIRVNLRAAKLSGPDLTGVDLTGAILTGVDLTGAILTGVIGADFTEARNAPD